MSDQIQTDKFDVRLPDIAVQFLPLPAWLADRLLRAGETITWVYGPSRNPSWERFVTHPGLFLVALALGAVCLGAGWLLAGSLAEMPALPFLAGGGIVLGSIILLGISNGHFTRLVVTTQRLVILQGHEICRSWNIDNLPISLIRYGRRGSGPESRSVDVGALQTMLGVSSDKVTERTTILAFAKQLDQLKARDKGPS